MSLYVQVVQGKMAQCIDTTPPAPVGQDGWKNAIEILPTPIPYRQGLSGPEYLCDKDPVEVVWTIYDFTIDERKSSQNGQNTAQFNQVVAYETKKETDPDPDSHYDPVVVADAQARFQRIRDQINAAATNEELDVTQEELNAFVPPQVI